VFFTEVLEKIRREITRKMQKGAVFESQPRLATKDEFSQSAGDPPATTTGASEESARLW